jgi:signal transduction histidine kinase
MAALALALTVALLGGYLLWRDVRRELRMAELRGHFVSSVSHELRTPLTAIRMFAETLRAGRLEQEKTREEYLDTIVSESERLSRLVDNVLDFSRIEQGRKTYRFRSTSLAEVVRAAARAVQYPLANQGFRLNTEVEEDVTMARADPDALEQAVLNLLTNAIKYSGDSREIGLQLRRRDGAAEIQVIDHGIGIPAVEQARIFEKFYRSPTRENELLPGTGLGLTLVEHVARAHGGNVTVESRPGEGSTFSIRIPLEGGP